MQRLILVQTIAQTVCDRWQRRVAPLSLAVGLGLTVGWLTEQAIAPAAVHAYTGTMSVAIDVQPGESYDTLMRRAETIARAATQRSFDRDILLTDVSITIIAQTPSTTVPVLTLDATRIQWRSQPDPRRWATYYSTSKQLLGLTNAPSTPATITQPTITTTTSTTSPQTQPRSTQTPRTTTAPKSPSGGSAATTSPQAPTTRSPNPILPQRIPTPGNIGK